MAILDVTEEYLSTGKSKGPHFPSPGEYKAVSALAFNQQRELIQHEICALLEDFVSDKMLELVCRIVVERFEILESKTDFN